MSSETPLPYPEEFHVDTSAATPPDPDQTMNRLLDLIGMRGLMTIHAQKAHQTQLELEERTEENQRRQAKLMQGIVGIVDEFGQLVHDTEVHAGVSPIAPPKPGFLSRLFSGGAKSLDLGENEKEWLAAFRRLFHQAQNTLENLGIHHVALQGQNLKTLEFEGQLVKSWVGVQNEPKGAELVVREVIRGLWVLKDTDKLKPVQRGEVLV
ncbi:MAG: hypothetical protein ACFCD0_19220 [Gemmataceae bacterium]